MNSRTTLQMLAVGLAALSTLNTWGQTNPPAPPAAAASAPKPGPGLLNAYLRNQSPALSAWDVGGQFRIRYQSRQDAGFIANRDFAGELRNDTEDLLLREKIHVGYRPSRWLQLYAEGRDVSAYGDERDPSPDTDSFDLYQGFVSVGDTNACPLVWKLGRQELVYGDERFVGIGDWGNPGRTFDAANVRVVTRSMRVDVFGGRVVVVEDDHANTGADGDWLSGIYASSRTLVPWQETDLYVLARNAENLAAAPAPGAAVPASTARDVYMPGVRVKSLPGALNGWDYNTELAAQVGRVGSGETRKDLRAFAADASSGYTWTGVAGTPRAGAGYTYASGDHDATDGTSGTFEPMFGSAHKFYGLMDLWGLRNIQSPRAVASVKPLKTLTLATEYHLLWLADSHDLFYPESGAGRKGNGYDRNPELDRHVGSELDLSATYAATSFAELQLGYGHFFAGDYLEQSLASDPKTGGAVGADWFYAQAKLNF